MTKLAESIAHELACAHNEALAELIQKRIELDEAHTVIARLVEQIAHMANTGHQGHYGHDDDVPWYKCTRPLCADARRLLHEISKGRVRK